jgi:hypothetical protein
LVNPQVGSPRDLGVRQITNSYLMGTHQVSQDLLNIKCDSFYVI